jgi:mono/diheme cytochrome c family protein
MATAAFVLFWVIVAFVIFLAAVRGGRGSLFDPQKRGGRRSVAIMTLLAVVVFGVGIPVAVGIAGGEQDKDGPKGVNLTASESNGRKIFAQSCVQCHTLEAANGIQTVGPNLDVLRPPKALTLDAIKEGRARGQGQMPSGLVDGKEAEDVAAFIAKTAGR